MITNLTHTTINDILVNLRNGEFHLGEVAIDRALTLLVVCEPSNIECSVMAAVESSRHHPCRIIVFVIPYGSEKISCIPCSSDDRINKHSEPSSLHSGDPYSHDSHSSESHSAESHSADLNKDPAFVDPDTNTYLDAQLRMGSEAGAGDVIILFPHGELLKHLDSLARPLLVSGAPCITWWTSWTPTNLCVTSLGDLASKNITNVMEASDFGKYFENIRHCHKSSNIDLSWDRITRWRALLTTFLDIIHCTPVKATVIGITPCLPPLLLAAWLQLRLHIDVSLEWRPELDHTIQIHDLHTHDISKNKIENITKNAIENTIDTISNATISDTRTSGTTVPSATVNKIMDVDKNTAPSTSLAEQLPYGADMTPEEILEYQTCPTNYQNDHIVSVRLECPQNDIILERSYEIDVESASIKIGDEPSHSVLIPVKSLADCLTQELNNMQEDIIYSQVIASDFPFSNYYK